MKKRILATIMAAMLAVTALAGCGGSAASSTAEASKEEAAPAEASKEEAAPAEASNDPAITIKLASTKATENYMYKGMEMFKEIAEAESGGSITVELYPASQLGGQDEIVEGIQMGTIEAAFMTPSVAESFYAKSSIPSTLFLAKNEDHALKIWQSEYTAGILEELKSALNVHCLDFAIEGARNVWTMKEVTKLEDLKGVKLRVPGVPTFVSAFTALGCNPTTLAMAEIYTGLQTGIVEGLENDTTSVLSNNFADHCKYCYKTNHGVSVMCSMIAESVWNNLTDAQRAALTKASKDSADWLNSQYYVELENSEKTLKDMGVTFTTPTDEEFAKMQELLAPVIAKATEGLATQEELDALRALAD